MIRIYQLIVGCCYLLAQLSLAGGPVWQVSKGEQRLYLGGTIHVMAESDMPLPGGFEQAYQASDLLVLETDMASLLQPAAQLQLMQQLIYTGNDTLRQHITADLYARLQAYAIERQLLPDTFLRMKPAGVMLTLLSVELERLGIHQAGADAIYFQRARTEGKTVTELESLDQHFRYIAELGLGQEEAFIRQSLEDLEQTESLMGQIVQVWKQGDDRQLAALVISDMQQNYPAVYQTLIVKRNHSWLGSIKQMLETPRTELVLVGAAHLVGPDGLLAALRQAGYQVEPLQVGR